MGAINLIDTREQSSGVSKWQCVFLALPYIPANAKKLYAICTMLDQRRRRWDDVVQMLYKCFVFVGMCQRIQANTKH